MQDLRSWVPIGRRWDTRPLLATTHHVSNGRCVLVAKRDLLEMLGPHDNKRRFLAKASNGSIRTV